MYNVDFVADDGRVFLTHLQWIKFVNSVNPIVLNDGETVYAIIEGTLFQRLAEDDEVKG